MPSDATLPPLTVYYPDGGGRGRWGTDRRAHIVAPPGTVRGRESGYAFCGTGAYVTVKTPTKHVVDPPYALPDGVAWCPPCIGRAAEVLGIMDIVAAAVLTAVDDARTYPKERHG